MLWLVNLGFAASGTVAPPVVVTPSVVAGGKPARKKRIVIDGRRYEVDTSQEAQLLKSWIDSLEEEKQDKQKELVKARKLVKKAKAYKAEPKAKRTAPQPKAPSLAPMIRSIERIEEKRLEALKRYNRIMAEIEDEEDAMAIILTLGL